MASNRRLTIDGWCLMTGKLKLHLSIDLFQHDVDVINAGTTNGSGSGFVLHGLNGFEVFLSDGMFDLALGDFHASANDGVGHGWAG